MLNDAEADLVADLAMITDKFRAIMGDDEAVANADMTEVVAHVHALQDKVLAQAAARMYPTKYRLMGARWGSGS